MDTAVIILKFEEYGFNHRVKRLNVAYGMANR